ncbi:MAG: TonB-dependent receptor, partial [Acidobacteriota bacterium]|nr:TonB-dependent receptor [Acidobacteriota bacterium]
ALPRIPPLRAQLSFNFPYRGLTVTPEWIVSAKQNKVDRHETPTDGYSLLNIKASYVWPMQHTAHILAVSGYNLTNESYRLHTSFIKDLAPEIGRGVKVSYSLRFF